MHRLSENPALTEAIRRLEAKSFPDPVLPYGVVAIETRYGVNWQDGGELKLRDLDFPLGGVKLLRTFEDARGFRLISGPYYKKGAWMLAGALASLQGCHVGIMEDGSGISIYRVEAELDAVLKESKAAVHNYQP